MPLHFSSTPPPDAPRRRIVARAGEKAVRHGYSVPAPRPPRRGEAPSAAETGGIRIDMAPPKDPPTGPTLTEQLLTLLKGGPPVHTPERRPTDLPGQLLAQLYGASDWLRRRPLAGDTFFAALVLVGCLIADAGFGLRSVLLEVMLVAPLALRRRWPMLTLALITLACLVQIVGWQGPVAGNVAVVIAIFSAVAGGGRQARYTALGLGLIGAVAAAVDWTRGPTAGVLFTVVIALVVLLVWVLGDVVRHRREVLAREQEQAAALEREKVQRAQLAQQEERGVIAREMHDIIAHSLSVVVVQADAGAYLAASGSPESLAQARQTLETIAATAREALGETRRIVGVLREPGASGEYAPQQGLAHVPTLVQRLESGGVPVELEIEGEVGDLPREIDLAAYRVVQEATTNVLKHAGEGASVRIVVRRLPAELQVIVLDDGAGAESQDDGQGHGILGMRERVAVFGGRLDAGPRAGGGFRVRATLPLDPTPGRHP